MSNRREGPASSAAGDGRAGGARRAGISGVEDGHDADRRPVPDYAWDWLQRSRAVRNEIAEQLTGAPAGPAFVERLRRDYARDGFVRGIVDATVAEIAFAGRPPARRPVGARWDRGLSWWAANLAGVAPGEFDRRGEEPVARQPSLFSPGDRLERAALVEALRGLLRTARDGQVPAQAVRRLLAQLDGAG